MKSIFNFVKENIDFFEEICYCMLLILAIIYTILALAGIAYFLINLIICTN